MKQRTTLPGTSAATPRRIAPGSRPTFRRAAPSMARTRGRPATPVPPPVRATATRRRIHPPMRRTHATTHATTHVTPGSVTTHVTTHVTTP